MQASHESAIAPQPVRAHVAKNLVMPSLGILDALMDDDSVSDILVTGTHAIYVDRRGQLVDSGLRFHTEDEVWDVAEQIMKSVNQHWSEARPLLDTRLPDGSRVNLVGPPIALDGVTISIRKFPKNRMTLEHMVDSGTISQPLSDFLKECVRLRVNIVVSGGTSCGKTSILNALSAGIPETERVVTIEDSAELRLQQPHVVRLEAKIARAASNGAGLFGAVTMGDLVKNALRMRPDRIVLGESRGPEAFDVLQAMNTGHDGSMTTLHANSPREAVSRLETMVMIAMPQMATKMIRQQIASSVNLIIQMTRAKDGTRHISHISEICGMEGDVVVMQDLVVYKEATPTTPAEYRWMVGAPRNPLVTEAARTAGILKIGR